MAIVAPSILAANFLKLEDECMMVNESEADRFHLDVMDGRFVPNISFGIPVIEQIKTVAQKPCEVHLMIEEPEKLTEEFRKAGADILIVHVETCRNLHRNIQQIKSLGMKAGVALNPHTPANVLSEILQDIDQVCVMSVNPGFGGQKFIDHTFEKLRELKKMIIQRGLHVLIEIDGGVTTENAQSIIHAGTDILVAGNTVFKSTDPKKVISQLKAVMHF
ncbi:MAG TPA: ribulose-phosphate 3-epimerase [Puia sp.]|nr:ribulose-phosphate 3-epimerase [Puia sp.]